MTKTRVVMFATLVVTQVSSNSASAITYKATLLHPPGLERSYASGASNVNQVGNVPYVAVLWSGTADSVINLHPTGYTDSYATGVSGGSQVGSALLDVYSEEWGTFISQAHAMLWHGTAASAVDLHPAGFEQSGAWAVDGDHQVGSGSTADTEYNHALLWSGTAASVIDLHPAGYIHSHASGVSGDSQVGHGVILLNHALLWHGTAASVVDLHPAGFQYSEARGVSGEMQVGVGSGPTTGNQEHALLWHGTAGSVVDLHPAGFTASGAAGVSGGTQVGWGLVSHVRTHALVWNGTADSAVDLHPFLSDLGPEFYTSQANGIAPNGTIVGVGRDTSERLYALLWTPVPEPSSCALIVCALAVAYLPRLRRHRN